jgi:hypothetical protein
MRSGLGFGLGLADELDLPVLFYDDKNKMSLREQIKENPQLNARHRRAFSAGRNSPPFARAAKPRGAASVRFPRPKIGELAHQAKGAGNFAEGEYTADGV